MEKDIEWLLNEKYKGEKTEGFFADCKRLESDEPLAYVIGSMPFLNTTIFLDSNPLIPRTETEYWVEKAIQEIKNLNSQTVRILDLCAGSGCIGVAILKNITNAKVDFAEIDESHHKTILKNIKENEINLDRTEIFGGDLFERINDSYDYILSNPPYIDPEIDRTTKSVRDHEPEVALYGGNLGLELVERIINKSGKHLEEAGILYIEHEPEQQNKIQKLAVNNSMETTSYADQFDVIRYTRMRRTGPKDV